MDMKDKDGKLPEELIWITESITTEVEIKPDLEQLHAYTQIKLALADQLRIIRQSLIVLGREDAERECGELVVKLAEDRFTLAVLGQFKRGKSSLMNSIIGRELLPTGMLPITSAITVLRYGPSERLLVNRIDSIIPDELPISALSDYVTEKGNPGNRKEVITAYVEVPVPFLRRSIEFVDTPGVGSAITANTETTYDFLPECDAVLFVTSVDMPMTSLELEFLKDIREYVDRIFFVVNKIDLVAHEEQGEVMEFVTETIRAQTGCNVVKIFPVSARLGLAARMSGDAILYDHSGIKALEEALVSFLSEEKSATFLAAITNKTLKILDNETALNVFGEASLQARTRIIQEEKSVKLRQDPRTAALAITLARTKLEALYKVVLNNQNVEVDEMELPQLNEMESLFVAESSFALPTLSVMDIAKDLLTRECPACLHLTKRASDFLIRWQYKISTESQAQEEFAAELGFCPLHTWQLLTLSSQKGASIGFTRLVKQIAFNLRSYNNTKEKGDAVQRLVHDSRNCRVCEFLRQSEEKYIKQLAKLIGEEEAFRNQYRHSQGVCLRHLGMLMNTGLSEEIKEFLLFHAIQCFEEDAEDMQSYALKRDALRRALHNKDEEDAFRRAIIRIVGGRSVCIPWAEDGAI